MALMPNHIAYLGIACFFSPVADAKSHLFVFFKSVLIESGDFDGMVPLTL